VPVTYLNTFNMSSSKVSVSPIHKKFPVHAAARKGSYESVRKSITTIEQLNEKNGVGETPIHTAVRWGRLAFVNNLIKAGASLTEVDDHQQQPLHLACSRGNLAVFQALFNSLMQPNRPASEKAAIQARDRKGNFFLHLAARREGSLKFIRMLAKEICINAENSKGQTCLMVAAKAGNVKNVKYILNSYANPFLTDFLGRSALHLAAEKGQIAVIELFMSNKLMEMIDQRSTYGESPLMCSIRKRKQEVATALITFGADCSSEDQWNQTAADYAKTYGTPVISALLNGVGMGQVWRRDVLVNYTFKIPVDPKEAEDAATTAGPHYSTGEELQEDEEEQTRLIQEAEDELEKIGMDLDEFLSKEMDDDHPVDSVAAYLASSVTAHKPSSDYGIGSDDDTMELIIAEQPPQFFSYIDEYGRRVQTTSIMPPLEYSSSSSSSSAGSYTGSCDDKGALRTAADQTSTPVLAYTQVDDLIRRLEMDLD